MTSTASRCAPLLALCLLLLPSTASALDTWEGYGPLGAGADVYLFGGVDPTGGPKGEPKGHLGGLLNGYLGLGPITIYGTFELTADPAAGIDLVGGGPGFWASTVDTAVFDLDLGFEFLFLGPDAAMFTPTPWIELNVDFAPDQAMTGLFARIDAPIYVTPHDGAEPTVAVDIEWTVGAYFTIAKKHQILAAWRNTQPVTPAAEFSPGEIAVGWNPQIVPMLALITEIAIGIPLEDELPPFSAVLGLELKFGGKP
jgi:hypothetical protein